MVVLLVLLSFIMFLTADWAVQRFRARAPDAANGAAAPSPDLVPALEPVFVAGYQLPEDRHYHRGHAWVRVVSPDTVVVGIDDFARRLTGRADALKLPAIGAWLEQGSAAFSVKSGGRNARFVAPVSGEVVEVNRAVAETPSLATDDPYGRGWLFKVRSSALVANLRNLFSGNLARRWTEDARGALEMRLMALSGSVMQDGGEPTQDFAEHLPPEEWKRLAATFLLA